MKSVDETSARSAGRSGVGAVSETGRSESRIRIEEARWTESSEAGEHKDVKGLESERHLKSERPSCGPSLTSSGEKPDNEAYNVSPPVDLAENTVLPALGSSAIFFTEVNRHVLE